MSDAHTGIRVATSQGHAFAFYLADVYSETAGKRYRRVCWINLETGQSGSAQPILEAPYISSERQYQRGWDAFDCDDYGFDVRSDGEYIYLMACSSDDWSAGSVNAYGAPKTSQHYIMRLAADGGALTGTTLHSADYGNDQTVALPYILDGSGANYSANPQICTVSGRNGDFVLAGAVDFSDINGAREGWYVQEVKRINGQIGSSSSRFEVDGPGQRTRTGIFPFTRKVVDGSFDAGLSWACLEEGRSGQYDSALELVIRGLTSTDAGFLAAEKGVGSFKLLSTPDEDGVWYAQTIFYTQTETVGERAQNRVKSIFLRPMADADAGDTNEIGMVFTDYDLSLPDSDFRAVTLGASKYLYWLSTVSKRKESDPDIWRITGVYYDSAADYRLKDFAYSPRQREWIVRSQEKTVTVRDGKDVATADGGGGAKRVTTNVLVPGALGGYTGAIRIPPEWEGRYDLRLRLANVSTYTNWMGAVALAQSRPELFAAASSGGVPFETGKAGAALADYGIQKLVYEWDENAGKLVLRQPAEALYAAQIEAPEPVDIDCDVHDIDVGHRLWTDYYGTAMLDVVINNYHTTREAVELTCAVYLDNARTPRYVSLPYDSGAVSAGKTTTITLPLKTFIPDADQHREARVVISARNVAETATVNNEFTLYLGKAPLIIVQHPRSVTVPVGGTATFTVGVTGGTPPYKYRWQVLLGGKWKDVPGANAATLTLRKVKLKWNGRQTRCVVTDAAGATVTSDAATLTVTKLPNTGDPTRLPLYLAVALIAAALLLLLRRRALRLSKKGG